MTAIVRPDARLWLDNVNGKRSVVELHKTVFKKKGHILRNITTHVVITTRCTLVSIRQKKNGRIF